MASNNGNGNDNSNEKEEKQVLAALFHAPSSRITGLFIDPKKGYSSLTVIKKDPEWGTKKIRYVIRGNLHEIITQIAGSERPELTDEMKAALEKGTYGYPVVFLQAPDYEDGTEKCLVKDQRVAEITAFGPKLTKPARAEAA